MLFGFEVHLNMVAGYLSVAISMCLYHMPTEALPPQRGSCLVRLSWTAGASGEAARRLFVKPVSEALKHLALGASNACLPRPPQVFATGAAAHLVKASHAPLPPSICTVAPCPCKDRETLQVLLATDAELVSSACAARAGHKQRDE